MSSISKPVKLKRASVACNSCRESKLKCLNNSNMATCQRCNNLNIKCTYTLKHSQLKRKKSARAEPQLNPITVTLPDKETILEVIEIFFNNQYTGIFRLFHKPSFISFLQSDKFDPTSFIENPPPTTSLLEPTPIVLLGILALCARLHPTLPKSYGTFEEANAASFQPNPNNTFTPESASSSSNYFGYHAKRILGQDFETPTFSKVQALCVLSSHEWGEGNASRSHMYSGIAARMAMILGLDEEDPDLTYQSHFLESEVRRRTMWSVYLMDRCNASGRGSKSCIELKDVKVRLPCDEKSFIFGTGQEQSFRDDVTQFIEKNNSVELAKVSCCGYMVYLFEIWRNISKWVGEMGGKLERRAPWDQESPYYKFGVELDMFQERLPQYLRFEAMNAHIANGSATEFAYFHGLYFLCRVFLCREYFYSAPESLPAGWWKDQATKLFNSLKALDSITKTLKPINLMVIAPFTGFEVFTTGSTSLYIAAYPSKVLRAHFNEDISQTFSKMAKDSLETLKSWKNTWGLGQKWIETMKKLKDMLARIADVQDDEFRHKMHDYGNIEQKSMHISHLVSGEERTTNKEDSMTVDLLNSLDLGSLFPDWIDAMI
ncbi:uncharacterized protein LODBEIA_P10670 [Lodderomyces beijingensis]|uniref:Zn(2)-C6 fungal-type domain-containing protein n=1 Tax=Lodderomyces beijingensis TaxID=1775926 RepID=A0ABP0ZGW6_9ASCO